MTPRYLYVEGPDDEHTVRHLMARRGFASSWLPEFRATEGKDAMLAAMDTAIRAGTRTSIGFLLDANDNPARRWQAVRSRLIRAGVRAPDTIPVEGFVGRSTEYGTRVGVWIMPDNRNPGSLEHFLGDLIPDDDLLISHAEKSTRIAKELGARFRDAHIPKAVLRTWLAWQRTPGLPYGTAIKAGFLAVEEDAADRFVLWFREVFGDPNGTPP